MTALPEPRSLTQAELAWLEEQAQALPGDWSLDVVRDPAELSAVLLPGDGDRFAATFLLDRVAGGYRLLACRWDETPPGDVFPTLADAMAQVANAAQRAAGSAPSTRLQ